MTFPGSRLLSALIHGRRPVAAQDDKKVAEEESAEAYRARLLAGIEREFPDARQALAIIRREIAALADPELRLHAPQHEVRYLLTYALTPPGPGVVVDVGYSAIYAAALSE